MTAAISPTGPGTVAHARRWYILAVLCLSLLIVFVGNSSLNVTLPDAVAGPRRHRVAAAVGRRDLLARVRRPAVLDRRPRRPLRPQGRAAVRPRRLPGRRAALARPSAEMWQLIACRGADGRRRRVHHAVDAVDPRQRLPAPRADEGDRVLGRVTGRRRRHRPGRERLRCWPTSGTARSSSSTSRSSLPRSCRLRSSAEVARSASRRRSTRVGAVLSTVGIVALVYGLIEAPDNGWASADDARRLRVAFVCLAAFVLWELHVDEPMLDMRYFRNPRVQHRHRRHGARVHGDVRRDVPDHPVLPAGARLLAARGRARACCRWRRS